MSNMQRIFGKKRSIVIGAIHFPPLAGYPDFPGLGVALENALTDLRALEDGGVDAVIIENNYDIPHHESVSPEVADCLMQLGKGIKEKTKLPIGISVLWNDYKTALTISKALDFKFIRVPAFVDTVKTSYGIMKANADDVISFRKSIDAEHVALFTDIHVKHSELVNPEPITDAARRAIAAHSDALIVTGKWTGDAPDVAELRAVREAIGDFPILCGSGVDEHNVRKLFAYVNGAIVSTSIKGDSASVHSVNVKPYDVRISTEKTERLVHAV